MNNCILKQNVYIFHGMVPWMVRVVGGLVRTLEKVLSAVLQITTALLLMEGLDGIMRQDGIVVPVCDSLTTVIHVVQNKLFHLVSM